MPKACVALLAPDICKQCKAKCNALPDPVCPRPRMSWTVSASGSVAIWIGNVYVIPRKLRVIESARAIPRSQKVVVTSVISVGPMRLAYANSNSKSHLN